MCPKTGPVFPDPGVLCAGLEETAAAQNIRLISP